MYSFNWPLRYKEFCYNRLPYQVLGDAMFLWGLADDGFGNLIVRPTVHDCHWKYGWGSGAYGI